MQLTWGLGLKKHVYAQFNSIFFIWDFSIASLKSIARSRRTRGACVLCKLPKNKLAPAHLATSGDFTRVSRWILEMVNTSWVTACGTQSRVTRVRRDPWGADFGSGARPGDANDFKLGNRLKTQSCERAIAAVFYSKACSRRPRGRVQLVPKVPARAATGRLRVFPIPVVTPPRGRGSSVSKRCAARCTRRIRCRGHRWRPPGRPLRAR